MSRIPRIPHVKVQEPNTELQERIINAVEELYPDYNLGEIARLYEGVDDNDREGIWNQLTEDEKNRVEQVKTGNRPEDKGAHPSTVTKTVDNYMAPEGEEHSRSTQLGGGKMGIDVPDDTHIQEYVRGYTEGNEVGFKKGVEWAERILDLPEGALTDQLDQQSSS